MELGAHVWLRKEDSHWGWVPAVVTKKEPVVVRGVELIKLTISDDPNIDVTMPSQYAIKSRYATGDRDSEFEVSVTVDPEQLKTADHEDIKIRNVPTSYHLAEGAEMGLLTPSTHSEDVVGGVDDLIGLTHLHEPAILHALRLRYDANIIYTSTGPILIAVNPFKKMDIYSDQMMNMYCLQGEEGTQSTSSTFTTPFKNRRTVGETQTQKRLPPHVYQIADDAYRAMLRGMENMELMGKDMHRGPAIPRDAPTNQSILVSGESGAGKTVTTKIVLNYFAMVSNRKSKVLRSTPKMNGSPLTTTGQVSIEQQVLQSNPILESFGNARTIRNDNSSRFGKYIDIRFARSGKLTGASIETYLLEKVRLIHPGRMERNYHVFYQFLSSATQQERRDLFITNMTMRDFRLLSQSGTYDRRDGVSDAANHKEMLDAMVRVLTICANSCFDFFTDDAPFYSNRPPWDFLT
jgi:myosin heavy subunit